jgi:hypothetical protein
MRLVPDGETKSHLEERKTMKSIWTLGIAAVLLCFAGCSEVNREAVGFRLPDGDIDKGKAAFVALSCNTCHSIAGVELPAPASPGQHNVPLGGEVFKVKSYGQLVTAIIHPSHDIAAGFDPSKGKDHGAYDSGGEDKGKGAGNADSPMPQFNSVMTVEQMIDITAFLHSRYSLREPEYYGEYLY